MEITIPYYLGGELRALDASIFALLMDDGCADGISVQLFQYLSIYPTISARGEKFDGQIKSQDFLASLSSVIYLLLYIYKSIRGMNA